MLFLQIIYPKLSSYFSYSKGIESGTYVIRNRGNRNVLDVFRGDRASIGYRIGICPAHYGTNQQWLIQKRGANTYVIRSRWHTGQFLDVFRNERHGSGFFVAVWPPHYRSNQLWGIERYGNAFVIRSKADGKVLDGFLGHRVHGSCQRVGVFSAHYRSNQLWYLERR